MKQDVVILTYTFTVIWSFTESRIAFIQAVDSLGNFNEPYPVYAREFENRAYVPIVIKEAVAL